MCSRKEDKRKAKDRRIIYAIVISLVLVFVFLGVGVYFSLSLNLKDAGGIACAAIVLGVGTIIFELLVKWKPIRSYERIRAEEEKEREKKGVEEKEKKKG